jgi:hypothetical protein
VVTFCRGDHGVLTHSDRDALKLEDYRDNFWQRIFESCKVGTQRGGLGRLALRCGRFVGGCAKLYALSQLPAIQFHLSRDSQEKSSYLFAGKG